MPVKSGTVKLFLGNLSDSATPDDLRPLFEAYGKVVEADVIKNYGFVHMEEEADAKRAIAALNGHELHGKAMVVEMSTGLNKRGMARRGRRCKIFVGNLHKDVQLEELRSLFERHGNVVEADIISNYAFVHMEGEDQAQSAIDDLNGHQLHGQAIRVQMSTSTVRQVPGMDKLDICYRCGVQGHWSKDCGRGAPATAAYPAAYSPYGPPTTPHDYSYQAAAAAARDRARYAPYPAYGPAPPPYRRDPYYDVAPPRREAYYDVADYYAAAPVPADYYDEYDLYERRGAVRRAVPLQPVHDPYDPYVLARRAPTEALYDRRQPTYRPAPPPASRHMY